MRPIVTRTLGSLAVLLALIAGPGALAQSVGTVEGAVNDANLGTPVPGVNLRLDGTTIGASTDADGRYSFSAPAGDYTLVASFVGYSTQRIQISIPASQSIEANFDLAQDALRLDEAVVTGYGTRERRNVATSISSIDGAAINELPAATADAALQGRAPGVTVLRSSGTPGGGVSVRIRGATSISGSNQPLYVVDGVPVSSGSNSAIGVGNQGLNALATVDTGDIESIEVLKDAAATAIYGTRAANGVVIITTKRGRAGQTRINAETSLGVSSIQSDFPVLSGPDYLRARNEGVVNQFGPTRFGTQFYGDPDADGVASSNFFNEVQQEGLVQNYRLGLNGGNETTRFLLSAGYVDEEGAIIRSGFERLNGRVNIDHTPNDRALVQASVSYNRGIFSRVENDNNIFGVITNALLSRPDITTRDSLGEFTPGNQFAFDNPVAAAQVFNEVVDTKFLGNVTLSYEVAPGLRAKITGGLDRADLNEDQYAPSFSRQGGGIGSAVSAVTTTQTWIGEGSLNYRRLFSDVHDVSVLGVFSAQRDNFERTFATGDNFAGDQSIRVNAAATTDGGSTASANSLLSFLASADYSYDGRYLLTLTGRVDGSSRFGENNRYALFPAVALGWNLHEEAFASGAGWLDLFKLRGSVGITGNQTGIGNFDSRALYGFGSSYAGRPGALPTQFANPDLRWETTTQVSGGLDFGVLNGRLSGTVEAYNKKTNDLLLGVPIPETSGFTGYTANIGSIENRGIEFALTTQNVRARNFLWTTTINLATTQNEVLAIENDEPFDAGFASRVAVGQPLGAFFGFQTDGLILDADQVCTDASGATCAPGAPYQQAGTSVGDVRFVDIGRPCTSAEVMGDTCPAGGSVPEPDGVINAADRTFIGDPNPNLFGGVTNAFNAFGFDLNAFVQFSLGNDVFNASRQFSEVPGGSFGTSAALRDRVQFDEQGNVVNRDATVPRATNSDPNDNDRDSDRFVEDGSYVRLKTLTLGYTVPPRFLNQLGGRSLRLYVLGENLFTATDYSGLDPEVSTFDRSNTSFGTDFFTFPQTRRLFVGLQLGL